MIKPYYQTELGRLYHGDCLDIMPHLDPVDLVLTDPPYGMKNNPNSNRFSGGIKPHNRGGGSIGRFKNPIYGDDTKFNPKPFLKYEKVVFFGYNHFADCLPLGTLLIWIKRYDKCFGTFLSDAEIAWMKGGQGVYCKRDLSLHTDTKNKKHPNQKPVPLFNWCIEKMNQKGTILDPYLGSGTTAIACERINRKWIGIEIEEKYCEIAAKRIEQEGKQQNLFKTPLGIQRKIYPKPTQQKLC